MQVRPLVRLALWSLLAGSVLAVVAALAASRTGELWGLDWGGAHAGLLLIGFLFAAVFGLHLHVVGSRTGRIMDPRLVGRIAGTLLAAGILVTFGRLRIATAMDLPALDDVLLALGWLTAAGAAILQLATLRSVAPQTSLVDTAVDPLTKGDDASYKHVKLAHMLLPLGLVLWAGAALTSAAADGGSAASWSMRLGLAGTHVALIGYGLLSTYGLGHFLIPRFSNVPAIAAGAIKGELHSSLLGIVLVAAAFLFDHGTRAGRGLLAAGGSFVFLGMFVYMGVLGANIMRNKSRTQRVTPEFVYVPWTFAGVFWLISGILMGLFLNAVPDILAPRAAGLRFFHIHASLFGGIGMLLLGWAHRVLPSDAGLDPPDFGASRAPFLLLNLALGAAVLAALANQQAWLVGAAGAIFLSLVPILHNLRRFWRVT